jgi:hypothetical protein
MAGRYHNEKDETGELKPKKDRYSNPADALQYLCLGMGEGRRMVGPRADRRGAGGARAQAEGDAEDPRVVRCEHVPRLPLARLWRKHGPFLVTAVAGRTRFAGSPRLPRLRCGPPSAAAYAADPLLPAPAPLPVFTPPPPIPPSRTATAQANQQSINSLQQIAQMDSASILARYGQQLSMANAPAGSPLLMR